MASFYSGWVANDDWRVRLDVTVSNPNGLEASVKCAVYVQTDVGWQEGYGTSVTIKCDSQSKTFTGLRDFPNPNKTYGIKTHTFTVDRPLSKKSISVSAKVWVPKADAHQYVTGATASGTVSISAASLTTHGLPSVDAGGLEVTFPGNSVDVTLRKAPGGNVPFNRFEVTCKKKRGSTSTQVYKGTSTTFSFVPSEITGDEGGKLDMTVSEIHKYSTKEVKTSCVNSIYVKRQTCCVYDENGKAKLGIVKAYDENGHAQNCIVTSYLSNSFQSDAS